MLCQAKMTFIISHKLFHLRTLRHQLIRYITQERLSGFTEKLIRNTSACIGSPVFISQSHEAVYGLYGKMCRRPAMVMLSFKFGLALLYLFSTNFKSAERMAPICFILTGFGISGYFSSRSLRQVFSASTAIIFFPSCFA